jgi:hypothetical protein
VIQNRIEANLGERKVPTASTPGMFQRLLGAKGH